MLQVKTAMSESTAHAMPRLISSKPLYVRLLWLLIFLFMLALFFKAFSEFAVKLQSQQVTTTLDANVLNFVLPDVYVCPGNPISGSYSANVDAKAADAINAQLNASMDAMRRQLATLGATGPYFLVYSIPISYDYVQSLQYNLLIDALAHRKEQDIITSDFTYNTDYGRPAYQPIDPSSFYHPMFLRCHKWTLNNTWQNEISKTGSSSGIVLTLNTDTNFSGVAAAGSRIMQIVYAGATQIPVSDWSLSVSDFNTPDREAGVRVFLTPPGEYPSDFVTSFSLGPGKHHTVEIDMTQQVYKDGQFDCVSDAPDVQFVNPYDQTPYSHSYSYSYCYYYEYHRQYQALVNLSGFTSPLPWPLRGPRFLLNLTAEPTAFNFLRNHSLMASGAEIANKVIAACSAKRPCSTQEFSVSISSSDWPTQSSLAPFLSSSVKNAWSSAKAKNLSVPALDFLMTGSASSVTSYVRSNLLKVHFKPHRVLCDRVTFSKDYGASNFISDIGGVMGIYLGMSLLTLCELLELIYDLVAYRRSKGKVQTLASQDDATKHADVTVKL